jgi:hypothetical protein
MKNMDVTVDEFAGLRDYVYGLLIEDGQGIAKVDLSMRMMAFAEKFSMSAMLRFKNWMLENGYEDSDVLVGIVHDLNDQNHDGFLPRTAGY